MSDFIFSTKPKPKGELTRHIQSIYHADVPEVFEYHGAWGSLGVSRSLYNGFQPLETDQHIFVVTGGPVLCFRDNGFLTGTDPRAGTRAIYNRWQSGEIQWDEDLSGPFAILVVDKESKKVQCISDLMSFLPIYGTIQSDEGALSTHVDILSKATGLNEIDKVSVADFILHGIVTFPYTFYTSIRQMNPASLIEISADSENIQEITYWVPFENRNSLNINEAAIDLRQSLQRYINRVVESVDTIGLLLSGGEDSRAVLAMLPKEREKQTFLLLDNMNREGKVAAKAAQAFGAKFNFIEREKLRYLKVLPACSDLVGRGSQYFHAHTYGYHSLFGINKCDAVFAGFGSDRLLKGCHLPKLRWVSRFPFLPQFKEPFFNKVETTIPDFIDETIAANVKRRRQAHQERLGGFRNYASVDEWLNIWPSSMAVGAPFLHANRRLFRSYEPFLDNKAVKIASVAPQGWKLNRRLFQKTVSPFLKPVKFLPHCKKGLPYYPWYINIFAETFINMGRYLEKKFGQNNVYQGSWAEWTYIINTEEWKRVKEETILSSETIKEIFSCSVGDLFMEKKMKFLQEFNLVQSVYHFKHN